MILDTIYTYAVYIVFQTALLYDTCCTHCSTIYTAVYMCVCTTHLTGRAVCVYHWQRINIPLSGNKGISIRIYTHCVSISLYGCVCVDHWQRISLARMWYRLIAGNSGNGRYKRLDTAADDERSLWDRCCIHVQCVCQMILRGGLSIIVYNNIYNPAW